MERIDLTIDIYQSLKNVSEFQDSLWYAPHEIYYFILQNSSPSGLNKMIWSWRNFKLQQCGRAK